MKKKILLLTAMTAVIFLLMTGCTSQKLKMEINRNGGGKITGVLLIEESLYSGISANQNAALQSMAKGEETIDGIKYVTFTETNEYRTYAEMKQALLDIEYPDMDDGTATEKIFKLAEIKKSGGLITSLYSVKLVTNAWQTTADSSDNGDKVKLVIEINMPGKITGYKGGEVSSGVFKYEINSLSMENEITVSSETTNLTFIILVVSIPLIVLTLFAIIARRR